MLQLREYPDEDILGQLEKGSIELAIIPGTLASENYHIEPLFSDSFCIIANKEHPLAQKEEIFISDMKNCNLATRDMSSITSRIQMESFMENNVLPKIAFEISDTNIIIQMAERNYAVGMLLTSLTDQIHSANIAVIPFERKRFRKTLYLVYKKGSILSNEASSFRNTLLKFYADASLLKIE